MSDASSPISLMSGRFERFARIDWWDQTRLRAAKVLVVGAGALGNEVVKNLSLVGVGHLAVADMDRVEESNLTRSVLFSADDEGEFKAEVLCRGARRLYPDIEAISLVGNILGDVGLGWFRWADVVVGALDNREARVFVNSTCALLARRWIDGGIDMLNGIVRGFAPPDHACYECTMNQTDWDVLNRRRSCSLLLRRAIEAGGAPTSPTTASVIGAMQAQEVVKFIHGIDIFTGAGFIFEGRTHNSYPVSYSIKPDCPWHESPPRVQPETELGSNATLGDVWDAGSRQLGELDAIDLGHEIVTTLTCTSCGISRDVFLPAYKVTEDQAVCSKCGIESQVDFAASISADSRWMNRSVREFGLPAWDILGRGAATTSSELNLPPTGSTLGVWRVSRKKSRPMSTEQHNSPKPNAGGEAIIRSSEWNDIAAVSRDFPVSGASGVPVRIAVRGSAHAEILSHAKASLDQEVCGVLVGQLCEDEQGLWMDAHAAIRGTSSKQGTRHVTYTQETWQKIYEIKDREYPKLNIVGWYHTHPGFGVEFSDMDKFVQQNFFSGTAQFALVLDPLGGDEAIRANTPVGLQDLDRFWIDGRQQKCWTPPRELEATTEGAAVPRDVERRLASLQDQVGQLMQTLNEERDRRYRFQLFAGVLIAGCVGVVILMSVLRLMRPETPPEHVNWVNVPVVINGKTVQLGLELKSWQLPPEMNALLVEIARQHLAANQAQISGSVPEVPAADAAAGRTWMTSLPVVIAIAVIGLALLGLVARMIIVGVRQGSRQRR